MKKILCLLLAVVFVLGMAACGQQAATDPDASTKTESTEPKAEASTAAPENTEKSSYYIGFSTLSTEGDFMSLLANQLTDKFTKAGHKFEVASSDFNPTKQIEQIENFISLGVDEIIIMAVDPSSLSDVVKKAMNKGIKIVAFSQETDQYDVFLGSDEFATGKQQAEMAAQWIEKAFPDAAPGSVEVAIFENRDKPTAAQRGDGLQEIAKLTPKAKVVKTVGVDTTPKGGQAAAENLMLTNPNVKVILSHNGDTAMGVDAYAMSLNSQIKDKAHFATFAVDFNGPAADSIKKSTENKSVWRGTVMMGKSLDELFEKVFDNAIAALKGTLKDKKDFSKLYSITPENVDAAAKGQIE
ncbi:monosaccharide ABC transporter substrate-binding protein (CUT2 family) [Anaerobacterium chartisolvens]|uniref:Monosaccharide ABC transporter substrate-binding protein (CUT2 family) n=1 Tax=Anaerobacterium chartisolvens TaxID=1297424 RepID=A0A369AKN8_9FIRM|nr:sugar ABC transporter substrate-binding protein [Anaerobacterium chartisolvens]RCX09920.1 monosaccharide ABC transporter substrate-binding protein (CUT2 family) [Anaerobacterium chartisolvens]